MGTRYFPITTRRPSNWLFKNVTLEAMFIVNAIGEIFHASCLMSAIEEWGKQRKNKKVFDFFTENK